MASIRIVQSQIEDRAEELLQDLERHSSFDGGSQVLTRILAGEHGVDNSLSGQRETDVILAEVVKTAIKHAHARGRGEGTRSERQRIADLLGLA